MFKKLTDFCVKLVQKYLPDPFLFCIILTLIVFVMGIIFTGQGPMDMVIHWSDGFWSLLSFSMQMILVLVTGHTLASAPSFKKILNKLSKIPKTPTQAIMFVTFISAISCAINWGFGLVIGAIFAKELAKEVDDVDYRLLIASAYSGFLVWHGGISGSIPLTLATGGESLTVATGGILTEAIPTSQTIFSIGNLIILGTLILTLPLLNKAMHPSKDKVVKINKSLLIDEEVELCISKENMTPADKLENSRLISIITSALGFTYIVYYFVQNGFDLNLNIVNFIFLFLGIFLHRTPKKFLQAIQEATKGCSGIILQFPFYAGIMGMMTGASIEGVSLASLVSNIFVQISNEITFPMFTFFSAGIVNFFVPSGGGQWAVQAPIMMPAGNSLGVNPATTAMAIAWGDAWTNMIQPFWALPALGIARLGAKDIMGFCIIDLLYSGVIITLGILFMGII